MSLLYSIDKLLHNQQVLPYFIHFLDSTGNLELIQFLIHLQSFYSSFERNVEAEELTKDAEGIFKIFFEPNAPKQIDFPVGILDSVRKKLTLPTIDLFKEAECFVYDLLEAMEFPSFKTHVLYKKHEAEVLQNNPILTDLIHIEIILQELLELTSIEDRPKLQFILACDAFEDEFRKSSSEQALEDAMGIYDRYISLQAINPLPITSTERLEVETSICQTSGTPSRTSFRPLRDKFCNLLSNKYLEQLKKSKTFTTYLDDLIQQTTISARSSVSDCESLNNSKNNKNTLHMEKEFMLASTSKSVLAEVDSLGRYKPMFDDRRWKSDYQNNKLKNKLTDYLNKKAAKEEEEATEAAMAIIQDVHRMATQRSFD